jgi:phytoene dehydrogenase-like protein
MAKAARAAGAEITLDNGVREVIVENGRAAGVVLDNGETVRAKSVASNVNPKLLYTRLIPSGALAGEFFTRMQRWKNGSGTFRMNVALSALPSFTARRRRSSDRRHHPGAEPGLHGPRLAGRPRARLEPRAGRGGADPLDARRHAGP